MGASALCLEGAREEGHVSTCEVLHRTLLHMANAEVLYELLQSMDGEASVYYVGSI